MDEKIPKSLEERASSYSTKSGGFARMPKRAAKPNVSAWRSSKLAQVLLFILVVLLVGFGGGWLGAKSYYKNNISLSTASTKAKAQYISTEGDLISQIAKDVGQSVVSVNVKSQTQQQDFFGINQPVNQQSAGTGFFISSDGVIMTNRHVVPYDTSTVSVTMADGTTYNNVKVLGRTNDSSSLDIAFLKVQDLKGKKVVPVTLGDSTKMQVGYKVVAIGNALGQFQNSVTSGIISGYGRDVTAGDSTGSSAENLTDLFQTDAAINEGNSGGPLVNLDGEVIGVNVATAGSGAQNIGFAIPINDAKGLVSSVLSSGKLQQPYLGVRYVSLTPDLANQYNLSVTKGAYIVPATDGQPSIISGSPAEKSGLKEKDVIVKVGSLTIDDKTGLTSALSQFKVGDKVALTINRNGKTIVLHTTIQAAPSQ